MTVETKFCTGCQCMRAVEGGEYRKTAGSKRWVCLVCKERKNESIYKSTSTMVKAQFDAKGAP